jgi:hypothetical protein
VIIVPRQARDKHRETQKKYRFSHRVPTARLEAELARRARRSREQEEQEREQPQQPQQTQQQPQTHEARLLEAHRLRLAEKARRAEILRKAALEAAALASYRRRWDAELPPPLGCRWHADSD